MRVQAEQSISELDRSPPAKPPASIEIPDFVSLHPDYECWMGPQSVRFAPLITPYDELNAQTTTAPKPGP